MKKKLQITTENLKSDFMNYMRWVLNKYLPKMNNAGPLADILIVEHLGPLADMAQANY